MPQTIRILLADDHKIVRDGLRSVLHRVADFEVVAEADDGPATIDWAQKEQPDVVVLDAAISRLNGATVTRRLLEVARATRVIALSIHSERAMVSRLLRAGAAAYLIKDSAVEELESAIRAVISGRRFLSASLAELAIDEEGSPSLDGQGSLSLDGPGSLSLDGPGSLSLDGQSALARGDGASPLDVLTPRERQVLQLLAEGLTTKRIAFRLGISAKTIESHRRNLMHKLDTHSVAELTKLAVREGLTPLDG